MNAQRIRQPTDESAAYQNVRDERDDANARVVQNLSLMQRFVSAVFADPTLLDDIQDGATVILIPRDDPKAASEKIAASRAMAEAGASVQIIPI